ncbi:hypothetical protein ACVGAB_003229 [Vibrio parahaemolyticus]
MKKTAKELIELGYVYKVEPADVTKSIRDVTALAIWSYLMSQDSSWEIKSEEIMKHFGIGRDRVRKAFKYLIDMKLLTYVSARSEDGKISGNQYFCFALPSDGEPENPSIGKDSQVTEITDDFDRATESPSVVHREPENHALKIRSSVGDKNHREPENPSIGKGSQVTEITDNFDRTTESPSVDSTESLKIRPLNKILNNKRSNNKPNGDFSDFVSGQHAYRDEQNKHDYSNPHPSIPSEVLSPAEIQFFKMGQIPVRFQTGNFSAEEIERIKKNHGLA